MPNKKFHEYPINKVGDCWNFSGYRGDKGYGVLRKGKRKTLAHRVAWEEAFGDIPAGLYVCHRCDNPSCVNPSHLFVGTQKDNMRDCKEKGRNAVGESGNAKLTEKDVLDIRRRRYLSKIIPGGKIVELAREYRINKRTVIDIANGPNGTVWQHLYEMRGLS